jgi:cell division protein FtsB
MARVTERPVHESDFRIVPRRRPRRFWSHALLFAASVLLVNGLFGERGLLDGLRAQRSQRAAMRALARLRQENDALREQARRLRDDPDTIEAVARAELGLMRAGEILVTVRDLGSSTGDQKIRR